MSIRTQGTERLDDARKGTQFQNLTCKLLCTMLHYSYSIPIMQRKTCHSFQVKTSMTTFPSSAETVPEPLGVVLVISAWNYPFCMLISVPLNPYYPSVVNLHIIFCGAMSACFFSVDITS